MIDCVSQIGVPVPQVSVKQFSTRMYHIAYYKLSQELAVNYPLPDGGNYIVYAWLGKIILI